MKFEDFTHMTVWQKAFKLVLQIYELTTDFPPVEKFGLISDMRRAANSITHNIAEGFGRYEPKYKTRFYKISLGSSYELLSQLYVSEKLTIIKSEGQAKKLRDNCKEIISELNSLIKTVESKP